MTARSQVTSRTVIGFLAGVFLGYSFSGGNLLITILAGAFGAIVANRFLD
jgi:uncharacterized membrane protein YeaQ/YmgE (transglycosylase-associated protein family)